VILVIVLCWVVDQLNVTDVDLGDQLAALNTWMELTIDCKTNRSEEEEKNGKLSKY
jgi:hypothetical protein